MSSANKNYTKQIINDYCVLDTETTGLSAYYDEIIEIGILKVRNNEITNRYSQLIKPSFEIDDFITQFTGITNEMLEGMPPIIKVKEEVLTFIGNDIILGHNTPFDMRFIKKGFNAELPNQYMDTMQFARKLYPELKRHRLCDLTQYLDLHNNEHRALSDCISTKELYDAIKASMATRNLSIEDLWAYSKNGGRGINIKAIKPTEVDINEDGFFFNKHVVFTGKLEEMRRKDAMQIVVDLGGILDAGVNKQTNYLILGDNDYHAILKGKKSNKHKKAEKLKLDGQDIEIIDEKTFYDLLDE
ncbi:3'-5' exonuclease [Kallipyga massiliensis]|uniref:3'-5' exonuclease n=1 Tax=Kallipyga massiliensis TaxID=1472764 RepID=UPI0004AEDF98|nr:3'-5' exonuclease [Kallipyga massiliensis]